MAGRSYRHIKRPAPWTRCPDYDASTSLFVNKHGEKHVSSRACVGGILHNLIPICIDQHPSAQSRSPMVMIFHGRSVSRFHAAQQWSRMSS